MFTKKNASQDVFSAMESLLTKKASTPGDTRRAHLSRSIDKLEKAINLLDKHNLNAQADVLSLFLQKFASNREYSECIRKIAECQQESAQSNAILNKAFDTLDADSVLDVEIDDDLSEALRRIEKDEE